MKKLFQIVLVSSLSLLCFSCYYDEIPDYILNPVEIPTDPNDPEYVEISFSTEIQPLFDANCINCHNDNQDPDLRTSNSYNSLVPNLVLANDAASSTFYIQIESGHGGLTTDQINLIKAWINQGAKNN